MTESTLSPDGQWMWTGSEWIPAPPVGGSVFSSKNESISVNKYPDESSAKSNDSIVEGEFKTLDRFMLISERFFRWFPLHQHKWLKFLGIHFVVMLVSMLILNEREDGILFIGMVTIFGLFWLHAPITIIGIYISKRASKKELNMEISLKQELDLAVSAHELIASIAHNSEDFHLSKKLQPYGLEIQRAADSRFVKNIVLTTAATMAAGTVAHQITKSK
jgi:hypothetical protein